MKTFVLSLFILMIGGKAQDVLNVFLCLCVQEIIWPGV